MKIAFIAGFGPIVREAIGPCVLAPGPRHRAGGVRARYFTNDDLAALTPSRCGHSLRQLIDLRYEAGRTTPAPQAWIEFDLESAEASVRVNELRAASQPVLRDAHEEPWGQTTARLLSPEGFLVGITFTPWMHDHDHEHDHDDHEATTRSERRRG